MIRAILVDDEKSGRETLHYVLKTFFSDKVLVLAMASSVKEAADIIRQIRPQLVFLDIEMPNQPGLQLVNEVEKVDFEIIVTTAHRQYGIEAIKAGVFDYLLKPVEIDELGKALEKLKSKLDARQVENSLQSLLEKYTSPPTSKQKIPILISTNKTLFVEGNDIIRCEADGNYTRIFFTSGNSELVTRQMGEMEIILRDHPFFRIHKSHLINLERIKSWQKLDDDVTMSDGSVVPLSRNLKAEFMKRMNLS
jgi:two-component system, LytTR family, response regulator